MFTLSIGIRFPSSGSSIFGCSSAQSSRTSHSGYSIPTQYSLCCHGYPTLKHITITSRLDRGFLAISSLVRGLPHLGSLNMYSIDPEALAHIGLLHGFKSLTLETLPPIPAAPTSMSSMFTALEALALTCQEDIQHATALLTCGPRRHWNLWILPCKDTLPAPTSTHSMPLSLPAFLSHL
jgi:hypothetical protein